MMVFFFVIPRIVRLIVYCVYNMRTQTIMESMNVVVDDANDLSYFSKEENISSLIEESGNEVGLSQPAETPRKVDFGPSDSVPIATEIDQTESSKRIKNISKDVLIEPIKKHSSRAKKNHPS